MIRKGGGKALYFLLVILSFSRPTVTMVKLCWQKRNVGRLLEDYKRE